MIIPDNSVDSPPATDGEPCRLPGIADGGVPHPRKFLSLVAPFCWGMEEPDLAPGLR